MAMRDLRTMRKQVTDQQLDRRITSSAHPDMQDEVNVLAQFMVSPTREPCDVSNVWSDMQRMRDHALQLKKRIDTVNLKEGQVTYADPNGTAHDQGADHPKRCDLFRWENSCESMSLSGSFRSVKEKIAALMTAMRQEGVGSKGGTEALSIFHQLIFDEWVAGSLNTPLARIKIHETKCFGMIGWSGTRQAAFSLDTLQ